MSATLSAVEGTLYRSVPVMYDQNKLHYMLNSLNIPGVVYHLICDYIGFQAHATPVPALTENYSFYSKGYCIKTPTGVAHISAGYQDKVLSIKQLTPQKALEYSISMRHNIQYPLSKCLFFDRHPDLMVVSTRQGIEVWNTIKKLRVAKLSDDQWSCLGNHQNVIDCADGTLVTIRDGWVMKWDLMRKTVQSAWECDARFKLLGKFDDGRLFGSVDNGLCVIDFSNQTCQKINDFRRVPSAGIALSSDEIALVLGHRLEKRCLILYDTKTKTSKILRDESGVISVMKWSDDLLILGCSEGGSSIEVMNYKTSHSVQKLEHNEAFRGSGVETLLPLADGFVSCSSEKCTVWKRQLDIEYDR